MGETISTWNGFHRIVGAGSGLMLHWLVSNGGVLAVIVTAGIAVLLVCCLECSDCSGREKDELFHRHGM